MNICHIAPFSPNRCGLYEACRDIMKADVLGGNTVFFVDAGITLDGVRQQPLIGAIDERHDFKLTTVSPNLIDQADIIVLHTGVYDEWLVKNQAPILWVIHGRPLACFRPESKGQSDSYSLYHHVSDWKRTKKMIYFWKEFKPFWDIVIDEDKQVILDYPVIDQDVFNPSGNIHTIGNKGKYNILICDSSREDIDLYELVIGCIEASKNNPDLKFHFYGFDHPIPDCWDTVLGMLDHLGCLGDLVPRVCNMELVYRSMDCLISPNRIVTRTIGEALSCGIPVISELGCDLADYTAYMPNPKSVSDAISQFVNDFDNGRIDKSQIVKRSKVLGLENYSKIMNEIYKEVI